jgi:C_GCAxxG_C_C family probable redox protein
MTTAADHAVELFKSGHNCAQAVLTCCGGDRIDRNTALAVAGAFGGGIGSTGHVCGAISGAVMVIGLHHPRLDPANDEPKQATRRLTRELMTRFKARNGSILCRDLLGYDLSKPEDARRAEELKLYRTICPKLVRDAAEILEEILD